MRPMATRYTRRGMVVYPFTSLPDDVIYSRRVVRASSVPPSPVLSAAELDYTPMTSRRLEVLRHSDTVSRLRFALPSNRRRAIPPVACACNVVNRFMSFTVLKRRALSLFRDRMLSSFPLFRDRTLSSVSMFLHFFQPDQTH